MKVNETYLDGQLRQELPVGVVANEPKADMAANLALWGEQAIWMPSVLATDRRLRWQVIDGVRTAHGPVRRDGRQLHRSVRPTGGISSVNGGPPIPRTEG